MHDPQTLAFEIKFFGIRWLDIWHVDPETDGTDDSCDWHGSNIHPHWTDEINLLNDDQQRMFFFIWQMFHRRLRPRRWYKHPKWHIHHWRLVSPILRTFKRWMHSKCTKCGKGFSWYESQGRVVSTGGWKQKGRPHWFSSSEKIAHFGCCKK